MGAAVVVVVVDDVDAGVAAALGAITGEAPEYTRTRGLRAGARAMREEERRMTERAADAEEGGAIVFFVPFCYVVERFFFVDCLLVIASVIAR